MIWIVADSAQELKTDRENGFIVADLTINADGIPFQPGFTAEEFYTKMEEKGVVIKSSQVAPAVYMDIFEEILKNPEDEVIYISLAAKLSGTYNSAHLAASGLDADRIHIVDSGTVCFSITLLVEEAFELRKQGKSAKEIAAILGEDTKKVRFIGIVPTLEYLKRGGRISAATAAIGDMVGIKPLLSVMDGVVGIPKKVRGLKKAYNSLPRLASEWGIDLDRPVIFGYTGLDPEPGHILKEAFDKQLDHLFPERIMPASFVLATHTGPNSAGVGFFIK